MDQLNYKGLSAAEVEDSRKKNGANVLAPPMRVPWYIQYLRKFSDPVIRILMIAAILSCVIGDWVEGGGILVAIALATFIAFINEYRAEKEFDLLNQSNDDLPYKVIREGAFVMVPRRDLVVGDVVLLQNETNLGPYIMRKAAERGLFIAFNASPIPGVENYPLEFVYWLFINEIEGAALSGETEPKAILHALREKYPRTQVILTLGGDGSYWDDGRETVFCPACHVQALDTPAPAPHYTGFFLPRVLAEDSGLAHLTLATCASGIAVTRPGAAPSVPTLAEVLASPIRPE